MRNSTKVLLLASALALGLTACSSTDDSTDGAGSESPTAKPVEQQRATPRLAVTYDGGILVLDGKSLDEVSDIDLGGFNRVNPAGDDRHVMVSTSEGFQVLDLGVWSEAHGDHAHYFSSDPWLTSIVYGGDKPGHVVVHDGMTTLFTDGTGEVRILDTAKIGTDDAVTSSFTLPAHHGVAVARTDGSVLVTKTDGERAMGVAIRDADGATVAENDDCPGVHGEAAAEGGVLTVGCQNGIVIVEGNDIRKVAAPDAYGRIGNQAGSEASPIVLGDYKTDKDAELERPRQFSLTNTQTGELRIVPFPASYSFRSLERGPNGEAILLGTDGALYVFDPVTAQQTARYELIGAWQEPDEWQDPMPNVEVLDGIAYVSDPATKRLLAVDLATGEIRSEVTLDVEAVELAPVAG